MLRHTDMQRMTGGAVQGIAERLSASATSFEKVIKMIDTMVATLKKEQADDDTEDEDDPLMGAALKAAAARSKVKEEGD